MLDERQFSRCRISRKNLFALFITPSSQEMESPTNPGRFRRNATGCGGSQEPAQRLEARFFCQCIAGIAFILSAIRNASDAEDFRGVLAGFMINESIDFCRL